MKPIILLNYDIPHGYTFINSLKEKLSLHYDIRWCGNIKDSELYNVKVIIVWQTLMTSLDRFINLEKVLICGSGVDEIIKSLNISSSIQLIRLVDESLREKVSDYVLMAVLNHYKLWNTYIKASKQKKWLNINQNQNKPKVGLMGLGMIGEAVANKLTAIGFDVCCWVNKANAARVLTEVYYGDEQLSVFANQADVLICTLPLTNKTEGVINERLINSLPNNAYIINVGRGKHIIDNDLLSAIDSGKLAGACLDVFVEEPLPIQHPFWSHSKITVTPHIAGGIFPEQQADYATRILLNWDEYSSIIKGVSYDLQY